MKKIAILAATVFALLQVANGAYTYDNSEDWMKLGAGVIAGVTTAIIVDQSSNPCYKATVSSADSIVEYALTASDIKKETTLDWIMWVLIDLGVPTVFTSLAVYQCLGTDKNFGWMPPTDTRDWNELSNADLQTRILAPWTQDFLISLISVATGLKMAIFNYDTVDPFYVAKKLSQGVYGSVLKLAQVIVFKLFGY
jgi:hypothetical protein